MRVASWFIVVAPIFGLWIENRISFLVALVLAVIVWGWCFAMLAGRDARRTPIHVILCRMILTAWIPFGTFIWWVQAEGVPRIFTFWEACYASFGGVIFFVGLSWGLTALARRGFGDSDPQLTSWESRGGHYFWDMVPWPWNPDAQATRNGG